MKTEKDNPQLLDSPDTERPAVTISKMALEGGFEFGEVARYLEKNGHIGTFDSRLASDIPCTKADLAISRTAFVSQAEYHTGRARDAAGKVGSEDPLKRKFSVASKILGTIRGGASHSGTEAGMLAICIEEAALLLEKDRHPSRLIRDMSRFASRTVDRVILTDRTRGFDGLVSSISTLNDSNMQKSARDLKRLGLIADDDPRLNPAVVTHAVRFNQLQSGGFLTQIKRDLWTNMHLLQKNEDSPFCKSAILKDTAHLVQQQTDWTHTSKGSRDTRQANFMALTARISERIAVNLVVGGHDPEYTKSAVLLGISVSAVERNRIYGSRARLAERDEIKTTKTNMTRKGRDRMM